MSYFGTTINDSATIVGAAAAALENNAFLAAKFDSNGKIVNFNAVKLSDRNFYWVEEFAELNLRAEKFF